MAAAGPAPMGLLSTPGVLASALLLANFSSVGSGDSSRYSWRGPSVRIVHGRAGLPSLAITDGRTNATTLVPAVWFTGATPGMYENDRAARLQRELPHVESVGLRVVSVELGCGKCCIFGAHSSSSDAASGFVNARSGHNNWEKPSFRSRSVAPDPGPEIMADGTLSTKAMVFLHELMAKAPRSYLLPRLRLDCRHGWSNPIYPGLHARPGIDPTKVLLQHAFNSSLVVQDNTSSPTQAWATWVGATMVKVMAQVDAAFPGRVIGAQIIHGVSYEGNYPAEWSSQMEGFKQKNVFSNMWADQSVGAASDFCRLQSPQPTQCVIPTVMERNQPTQGNSIVSTDSDKGKLVVDFNRFSNRQMAAGIAAVGAALKGASDGHAFTTTLYGGFLNGLSYATAGGDTAETDMLGLAGIDGIGNPPMYEPASRSDDGTMAPQGLWDSPKVHGKLYVVEYDLRTFVDPGNTSADFDYLHTLEATADLVMHDFAAVAIRGHGLYIFDPGSQDFASNNENQTAALWSAVQDALQTAALYRDAPPGRPRLAAEMFVFVDDISTAHWPVGLGPATRNDAYADRAWPNLALAVSPFAALPFPVRFHLLSDLLSPNFSGDEVKLAVLLNPLRVSADLATAIKQKLYRGGKTVLYSTGAGILDGDGKSTTDGGRELLGLPELSLGKVSSQSRRTVFSAAEHREGTGTLWPLTAAKAWAPLVGQSLGTRYPVSPWQYVNCTRSNNTVVLGHYEGTQLPSLVKRTFPTHSIMFSANPLAATTTGLPTAAWNAIAAAAGVHSYLIGQFDTTRVEAGGNLLVVHHAVKPQQQASSRPQSANCTVLLPRRATVFLANGSKVCEGCTRFNDCEIERRTRVYVVKETSATGAAMW